MLEVKHTIPDAKKESTEDLAKKRRRLMMSGPQGGSDSSDKSKSSGSALTSLADLCSYKIDVKTKQHDISMSIVKKHKPNLFEYLDEFAEALDPDSGIKELYHPKNNKVFTWRAMRLLHQKHVGRLGITKDKH